jgi:hypothetical protein
MHTSEFIAIENNNMAPAQTCEAVAVLQCQLHLGCKINA